MISMLSCTQDTDIKNTKSQHRLTESSEDIESKQNQRPDKDIVEKEDKENNQGKPKSLSYERIKQPFLWKIERKNPSYLFGTIHMADKRLLDLPDVVIEVIIESDTFYSEVSNKYSSEEWTMNRMLYPENETLEDHLPQGLYHRLEQYLDRKGIQIGYISSFKTWAIVIVLSTLDYSNQAAHLPVQDNYLENIAWSEKKTIASIEDPTEQIRAFDVLDDDEQAELLSTTLDLLEDRQPSEVTESLIQAYLSGNATLLAGGLKNSSDYSSPAEDKISETIFSDRNQIMADRVDSILSKNEEQGFFFAFGSGHFTGEDNVIDKLRSEGYNITRAEFTPDDDCSYETEEGYCYLPYQSALKEPDQGFVFEAYPCTDIVIKEGENKISLLRREEKLRKTIITIRDIGTENNLGRAKKTGTVQANNYHGDMVGFIELLDSDDSPVIDNGEITLRFENYLSAEEDQTLYMTSSEVTEKDFKKIIYYHGDIINETYAYFFRIDLDQFSIKPDECLGKLYVDFKGQEEISGTQNIGYFEIA